MDLSIVIVNYNSLALLKKCVDSITRSKPSMRYEIIIVDNSDTGQQVNGSMSQRVRLITNSKNVGFGKANNQGVSQSKGTYLLLLNVDTEVVDTAIDRLYSFITSNDTADIAAGKLLNTDRSDQPSAGPFYRLPVVFGMLFLKGDHWGLTRSSPHEAKQVDWVSGACMMMEKKDYEQLNGFDENIFMYMEEIDLLYRAKQKGLRVYFYPDAQFIHVGAATSGTRITPILNIYAGLMYFYRKHYSSFETIMLKLLLAVKAYTSIVLGTIMKKGELVQTYRHALKQI